jgi:hypothetical protein
MIHHETFNSPALYFTLTPPPMDRQLVLEALGLEDDDYMILSQEEHPVLGGVAWFLHPCQTKIVIDMMMTSKESGDDEKEKIISDRDGVPGTPLLSFLTVVLPVVKLSDACLPACRYDAVKGDMIKHLKGEGAGDQQVR